MEVDDDLPNLLVCTPDKRTRLVGLVKAYYHQLATGCGDGECTNKYCKSAAAAGSAGMADTALLDEAKKLARGGFREPHPVFYFCPAYCYPVRAAAATLLTEDRAAQPETLTRDYLMDALANVDAALWMFFKISKVRGGRDVYDSDDVEGQALLHGGALGMDVPAARGAFRALAANEASRPHFEAAVQALLKQLAELSKDKKPEPAEDGTPAAPEPSAYKTILAAEQQEVADCRGNPNEHKKLLNKFLTYRLARLFVLLFECPTVVDETVRMTELCAAVAALHQYIAAPLCEVWALYPAGALQRIVASLQTYITVCLFCEDYSAGDAPIQYVPAACMVLSILFEANYTVSADGLIPYAAFYNDTVNDHIDAKDDFDRWRMASDPPSSKDEQLPRRTLQDVFLEDARIGRRRSPSAGLTTNFSFSNYPFLLNAAFKHSILQHHSSHQQHFEMQRSLYTQFPFAQRVTPETLYLILNIDRHDLLRTTMSELNRNRDKMRRPLRVQFKNEEGIDEGGVKKEFFQMVIRQLLDPSFGMFTENEQHIHWFQPRIICSHNDIEFMLIGKMIGLAIYNQVILDINFPPIAFKKLLNIESTFDDLRDLDPELYTGLRKLLTFDEALEGATVEDTFCRTFTVTHEVFGEQQEVELKPGGRDIPLTAANREEYVDLYTKYVCDTSVGKNFKEFQDGFYMVCGAQAEVLKTFHPKELEEMVVGCSNFNLEELEETARYDGYNPDDQTIKDFWSIIQEMDHEEQRMFLKFCTGTDRLPIRGLRSLGFVVGKNGGDSDQLPSAHTCFNHLLLPEYNNREKLKTKLMNAIRNCQGFGLM